MTDNQTDRFSQTRVQEELLGAEDTQQLWDGFWDGKDGLKHSGRAFWLDIDEPEDFKLDDLENMSLSGNVVNGFSRLVRSEIYGVLEEAEEQGDEGLNEFVRKLFIHGVEAEMRMEDTSIFDLESLKKLWIESGGADELEDSIRNLKLDILKATTLFAILDSCQNFEQCQQHFEQWEQLPGFHDFISVHLFTLWLEKSTKWEEKRVVLLKAKENGLGGNEGFTVAIFEGIGGISERKDIANKLLEDDELGEGYRDKGFFNEWIRMERIHLAKIGIIQDEMKRYGVEITAYTLLASLVNLHDRTETFGVFRTFMTKPTIKELVTKPEFMHLLFSEDCFSFREKIALLNLYKEYHVNPDAETLVYIYANENDLHTLRNGMEVLVNIYRRVLTMSVPKGLIKKLFVLSLHESVDEIMETCDELRRLHVEYERDDLKFGYSIEVCERIVADEECRNYPNLVMEACVRLITNRYDGGVPGDDMMEAVDSFSSEMKIEMRKLLERFFENQDVDIEEEFRYFMIGMEVSFELEGEEERDFEPWLELYGKTRKIDVDFQVDSLKLRWEEGLSFNGDTIGALKGLGAKKIAKIRSGMEAYFGHDGRPSMQEVDDEGWKKLFRLINKKKKKGNKGMRGRRR